MPDPYLPPNNVTPPYPVRNTTNDGINQDRPTMPASVQVQQSSGFGTGILVAIVFAVVAAMAYAFYSPKSATSVTTPTQGAATTDQSGGNGMAVPDATTAPAAPAPAAPAQPDPTVAVPPAVDPAMPPAADPATPPVADPAVPPTTSDTAPAKPVTP